MWFREALPKVEDAASINALLERATKAGKACKALLHDRATALGMVFDKKAGQYAQAAQKDAAA